MGKNKVLCMLVLLCMTGLLILGGCGSEPDSSAGETEIGRAHV